MPERSNLIDSIRQQNREFRKLEEKHREYEAKLDELMKHIYLTPAQEMLKQEIKKQKLRTKDKMAEIIQGFVTINSKNGD
ncbi:MAG: YdcH family protein [bacterium]